MYYYATTLYDNIVWFVLAILLVLCSALCKETGITTIAIILCYQLLIHQKVYTHNNHAIIIIQCPVVASLVVYNFFDNVLNKFSLYLTKCALTIYIVCYSEWCLSINVHFFKKKLNKF